MTSGANINAAIVTFTSVQNGERVERLVDEDISSVSTIDSLTDFPAADILPPQTSKSSVGFEDVEMTHKSTDDDLARINIEIGDTQHLIKNSTCVALEIAKEDVLQLQYSLYEKKKMTTSSGEILDGGLKDTEDDMAVDENACDLNNKPPVVPNQRPGLCAIGGINTVDQLDQKVLNNNTAANAISTLCVDAVHNMVTPVWKYSQYQSQRSSIAALPTTIWKKIKAFKNVGAIVSQSHSTKFQDLWSKSNAVAYSFDTPVLTIIDFISVLDKKKDNSTKTLEAHNFFPQNLYCSIQDIPGSFW